MNEIVKIANPLGSSDIATIPAPGGALANTDQQRAIAEVQAAMFIARSTPRNEKAAIDKILNACQRRGLAERAVYSYARGGSDITGPSIRLAEAIAQNWGNVSFGIREIEQTRGNSVVQAYAWDLETNVRREMNFHVPHIRHTKQGSKPLSDPRDIYEMVANNGARRLRSCILAVIPGDIVDLAVEQCEATMKANADTSPQGVQNMVQAFQQFGVVQQQLEQRIQRRLDAIQPAQVVALKKIYASLRDGMSQVADWFEPVESEDGEKTVPPKKGNAAAKAALKQAAASTDNEGVSESVNAETGEITPSDAQAQGDDEAAGEGEQDDAPAWAGKVDEIREGIAKATTPANLKAIEQEYLKHTAVLPKEVCDGIESLLRARRADLSKGA